MSLFLGALEFDGFRGLQCVRIAQWQHEFPVLSMYDHLYGFYATLDKAFLSLSRAQKVYPFSFFLVDDVGHASPYL